MAGHPHVLLMYFAEIQGGNAASEMVHMPQSKKSDATTKARVLIVDDQPVVRERLAQLIRGEAGLELCGEADNPCRAFEVIVDKQPHLVVTGLALKDAHGLEFVKDLHLQYPHVRVLVFSLYDESLYAERAIRAGANGFLTTREPTKEVLRAIHTVLNGEIYLSHKVTGETVRRFFSRSDVELESELCRLSDRELEIFELIGGGRSTKQIANALHVDVKTIETYRSRIKVKLGLRTGVELVARAQASLREITSGRRIEED
jgi:DNA-binding NarL/FixJ family response regulator